VWKGPTVWICASKSEILRKHALLVITTAYDQYSIRLFTWDRYFIEEYYDNDREHVSRVTVASATDINKHIRDVSISELNLPWIRE
jgi:hypothetical protein